MSDLTKEQYQQAYDEEMTKLDAEAAKATTTTPEPTVTPEPVATPEPTTTPPPEGTTEPTAQDEIATRMAALEKSLEDTKRWAHQNAAEVKRLKKEAEDRERAASRPELLDANPGLEEAIRHVTGVPTAPSAANNWLDTVNAALPDLDETLGKDADFRALAQQKRAEMGATWDDPIAATRELGKLLAQHQVKQATAAAVEKARQDFAVKQKKSTAMQVPGGNNGTKTTQAVDEAERIRTMPSADFEKMRAKTLGF